LVLVAFIKTNRSLISGGSMRRGWILLAAAASWLIPGAGQTGSTALSDVLNATTFRNIGPIQDVSVGDRHCGS
jgi:hypothetical protein